MMYMYMSVKGLNWKTRKWNACALFVPQPHGFLMP